MHMGHFGTSASATLGNAHAAALRARRVGRFSLAGRFGAGPFAAGAAGESAMRRHAHTGRGAPPSGVLTRAPRRGSIHLCCWLAHISQSQRQSRRRHSGPGDAPSPSGRHALFHCDLWESCPLRFRYDCVFHFQCLHTHSFRFSGNCPRFQFHVAYAFSTLRDHLGSGSCRLYRHASRDRCRALPD
jgi:hypothetical protein